MGAVLVVVDAPRLDHGVGVVHLCELIHVRARIAQAGVERFNTPVVRGPADRARNPDPTFAEAPPGPVPSRGAAPDPNVFARGVAPVIPPYR